MAPPNSSKPRVDHSALDALAALTGMGSNSSPPPRTGLPLKPAEPAKVIPKPAAKPIAKPVTPPTKPVISSPAIAKPAPATPVNIPARPAAIAPAATKPMIKSVLTKAIAPKTIPAPVAKVAPPKAPAPAAPAIKPVSKPAMTAKPLPAAPKPVLQNPPAARHDPLSALSALSAQSAPAEDEADISASGFVGTLVKRQDRPMEEEFEIAEPKAAMPEPAFAPEVEPLAAPEAYAEAQADHQMEAEEIQTEETETVDIEPESAAPSAAHERVVEEATIEVEAPEYALEATHAEAAEADELSVEEEPMEEAPAPRSKPAKPLQTRAVDGHEESEVNSGRSPAARTFAVPAPKKPGSIKKAARNNALDRIGVAKEIDMDDPEEALTVATNAPSRKSVKKPAPTSPVPEWYKGAIPVMITLSFILTIIGLWAVGAIISMLAKVKSYPLIDFDPDTDAPTSASWVVAGFMALALFIAIALGIMAIIMQGKINKASRAATE